LPCPSIISCHHGGDSIHTIPAQRLAFLFAGANHEWFLSYPTAMIDVLFFFWRSFFFSKRLNCANFSPALHFAAAIKLGFSSSKSESYMLMIQIS
jgi:hypothetical protein